MTSKFIKTALTGLTLVLGAAQSAQADGIFTVASIQGKYAYANSGGDVASFGPMRFDGRGGVSFAIKVNVACATPGPSCQRTIINFTAVGTYTVNSDGTGVATVTFTPGSTGKIDFVITEATRYGEKLLATQLFAAAEFGGVEGQLSTPTWSRVQTEVEHTQHVATPSGARPRHDYCGLTRPAGR